MLSAARLPVTFLIGICIFFSTSIFSEDGLTPYPFDVQKKLNYSFKFDSSDHVAHGTMLRNRTSGTIHFRGVPRDAQVVAGILYFNFIDMLRIPDTTIILFDGNAVTTSLVANSDEPCWDSIYYRSHTLFADVTPYILTKAHPNQDYSIVLPFSQDIKTTGEDPWRMGYKGKRLLEGATLVIIYHSRESHGPVFIYDKLSETMFSRKGEFYLEHFGIYEKDALFTVIGADGQRGRGHDNLVSNEQSFFNGIQIAGPQNPVTTTTCVDWDGSDGWPLPQLWDTHTHMVSLKSQGSVVTYKAYNREYYDCVVPVAFIIDVR